MIPGGSRNLFDTRCLSANATDAGSPWASGQLRRPNPPEVISLFASREDRLDSLADGDRPQGHSRPLTGSLLDSGSG